jgi:parallel beta-helix repeat protein
MLWLTTARKHWSRAVILGAALMLGLATCLPAWNGLFSGSSSWEQSLFPPLRALACSARSDLPIGNVGDHFGEGLRGAYDVGRLLPPGGFVPHAPILITSDSDFASQGWPGAGTANNPYLIEGLGIARDQGNSIEIRFTTAYFCVRQCNLTGNNEGSGVYLEGVVHGLLENNLCVSGARGIYVEDSEACQVVGNTCEQGAYGICLEYCQSVNATDNLCKINSVAGIRVYESEQSGVARNLCTDNAYGIEIRGGDSSAITDNTCSTNPSAGLVLNATRMTSASTNECDENWFGIVLQDASDTWLTQNTCQNNSDCGALVANSQFNDLVANVFRRNRHGIALTRSISNYVAGNVLEGNVESGVYLYLSEGNQIDANTMSGSKYGVYAVASRDNTVTINTLSNNTWAGILLLESPLSRVNYNTFVRCGLELQGESYLDQREVTGNTVNGAPLIFLQGWRGGSVPSGAGQVVLLQCRNVTIENQNLSAASIGLLVLQSSYVTVENTVFSDNSRYGVEVWGSRIMGFSNNSFVGNGQSGIVFHSDCSENSIRRNFFAGNSIHNAVDDGAFNIFDRNFWSDYVGYDRDLDGLGDDSYLISGQALNHDWNPLMAPPGVSPPAQLLRWILTIVTALVVNSLIIGIGMSVALHYRRWALKSTGRQ